MTKNAINIFLLFNRIAMGWTFLYPGLKQVSNPNFSIIGLVSHTKTFNSIFAPLAEPGIASVLTLLVSYGHVLLGIALITGMLTRLAAPWAAILLMLYWMAHMDFPYIETNQNFILDYHVVYAALLIFLAQMQAGRIWGIDGILAKRRATLLVDSNPA
jgi:thiosulfate dehydrogenase [quinone] large subunit